jgi:hypothetical protein
METIPLSIDECERSDMSLGHINMVHFKLIGYQLDCSHEYDFVIPTVQYMKNSFERQVACLKLQLVTQSKKGKKKLLNIIQCGTLDILSS